MYWALQLTKETSIKIQRLVALATDIPKDWTVYCDHITVAHSKQLHSEAWEMIDNVLSNFEGHSVPFRITGLAENENVIAVKVSAKTLNKHSHITIACAQGHFPVESNDLKNWTPVLSFEKLYGTLTKKN